MPWEFVISRPEDMGPFADLLEEVGHPGDRVARHLANTGKFPLLSGWVWQWHVCTMSSPDKLAHELPSDSQGGYCGVREFYTATEAVWAVINAGRYMPWAQRFSKDRRR